MAVFNNRFTDKIQARLKKKRFLFFAGLLEVLEKPVTIIDIGGTVKYWEDMGYAGREGVEITTGNIFMENSKYENLKSIVCDGRDLSRFPDSSFDIVYSNSVLEHISSEEGRKKMAGEIRRVGRRYFVQTPNYYFPIEPHYRVLGFQWLPAWGKAFLLRNCNMGRIKRIKDKSRLEHELNRIRLLRERELRDLFPDGTVYRERFCMLTKSIIVYRWDN